MKLNVNDWEDLEDLDDLPPKQKIVKKKTKDYEAEKELKSKKNNNYRKGKNPDENI